MTSSPGQDLLTESYKGVLEEYFTDEDAWVLFRSVVGQLLAAFEPLSITSLITLRRHDSDSDSVGEALRYLGSLLSNVSSSDSTLPIVLLHTSFRDFVTNEEKGGTFYIDLRVAHSQMAHSCLSLLLDESTITSNSASATSNRHTLPIKMSKTLIHASSNTCHLLCRMPVVFGMII